MLSKACKSVFVIVFLFTFISANARLGVVAEDWGAQASNTNRTISVDLLEKNTNQVIVATLLSENGNVIDVVRLNNNFSTKIRWGVKSGSYKVSLVDVKTGEREIHYVIL